MYEIISKSCSRRTLSLCVWMYGAKKYYYFKPVSSLIYNHCSPYKMTIKTWSNKYYIQITIICPIKLTKQSRQHIHLNRLSLKINRCRFILSRHGKTVMN
jgi:hypothetical protein